MFGLVEGSSSLRIRIEIPVFLVAAAEGVPSF
jgi:hypothetical protein